MKKIHKLVKTFIHKWINGECKHLCISCKYRKQCVEDYGIELIIKPK